MKQFCLKRQRRNLLFLSLSLFLSFATPLFSSAQPSWGPPGAASQSDFSLTCQHANASDRCETINCDLYFDMSTTSSPGDYLVAVVWDEYDGSTWKVYGEIREAFGSVPLSFFEIANNARHPDVIIGDDPAGGAQGAVEIAVVYETTTGTKEVVYKQYTLTGLFGYGTPTNPSGGTNPSFGPSVFNADPNNDARDPHIDALPEHVTSLTHYNNTNVGTGYNPNYMPLNRYVITWTEVDTDPEVWLIANEFDNIPTSGSTEKMVATDAERSDVAGLLVDDTDPMAYVSYIDNPSGDILMDEYDIDYTGISLSSSISVNIDNMATVIGTPRIDAPNVQEIPGNTYQRYAITAAYDNGTSGQEEVKVYDSDFGETDFGTADPYQSPGTDGYYPAIATGPGPDDYNANTSLFGNMSYIQAHAIDFESNIYATALDHNNTTQTFSAYETVCSLDVHSNVASNQDYVCAVGTGSNCGAGHVAAWYTYHGLPVNGYTMDYKINTGTTMSFKPGKETSIVSTKGNNNFSSYPNPANNIVFVEGVTGLATYTATDISGRTVLTGTVQKNNTAIDISTLSKGVYIFNFNENGNVTPLKLVKQ